MARKASKSKSKRPVRPKKATREKKNSKPNSDPHSTPASEILNSSSPQDPIFPDTVLPNTIVVSFESQHVNTYVQHTELSEPLCSDDENEFNRESKPSGNLRTPFLRNGRQTAPTDISDYDCGNEKYNEIKPQMIVKSEVAGSLDESRLPCGKKFLQSTQCSVFVPPKRRPVNHEVEVEMRNLSFSSKCGDEVKTKNMETLTNDLVVSENEENNDFVLVGKKRRNKDIFGKQFLARQHLNAEYGRNFGVHADSSGELVGTANFPANVKEKLKNADLPYHSENRYELLFKEEDDNSSGKDVLQKVNCEHNGDVNCSPSQDQLSTDWIDRNTAITVESYDNERRQDCGFHENRDNETKKDEIYESDEAELPESKEEEEEVSNADTADGGDFFMQFEEIDDEKGEKQKLSLFPSVKDKGDLICSITRQDVVEFQRQSHLWYTENRPTNAYEGYGNIPMTYVKPDGTCALYRVVSSDGTKLRLQAITVDLWLDGRGDLREIGMTMHAVNTLCGKRFGSKKFFVGDVVFVQKLRPTKFALEIGGWNDVTNTDARECYDCFFTPLWNVQEYQLVQRITLPNRLAVAAEREKERVRDDMAFDRYTGRIVRIYLALEGAPDLFRIHTKILPKDCTKKDTVMVGTVLVPRGRSAVFSFAPKDLDECLQLTKKYTSVGRNITPKFGFLFSRLAGVTEDDYLKERDSIYKLFSHDYAAGTAWLRRGFGLAIPSLGAIERYFMDTDPHKIVLETTENEKDYVRFECTVGISLSKKAWRSDRHLLVDLPNGTSANARTSRVSWDTRVEIEAKATGMDALSLYENNGKVVVFQQVAPIISGLEEEFYSSKQPLIIGGKHRFHRAFIAAFGGPPLVPVNTTLYSYKVWFRETELTLLPEQVRVLDAALRSTSPLAVAASFGSGKTFIANVILVNIIELSPDKVHLLVAQSNYAVVNAVNIAYDFDDYRHLRIVRIISPQNMGLREERTQFDLPVLMRQLFSSEEQLNRLSPGDRKFAEDYLKLIGRTDELPWDMREKIHRRKRRDWSKALRIFVQLYKPQRIFCTTSTLLLLAKENGGMGKSWTESVDTIVFDEASQLSAPTFALLAHRLPKPRPILIGDVNQLEPFVPSTRSELLRKLATGNILQNIAKDNRWPTFTLNSVFRCHPELTLLLSKAFYANLLNPAVSAAERSGMLNSVQMPNPKYPIAILGIYGSERSQDTSYINEIEEVKAVRIANILKNFVENDNDIAIICMYRAQADNIAKRVRDSKIFVGTIDATQGREFRASIICTTRTKPPNVGDDGINFFTHFKRVNVALSRSKELIIILGTMGLLEKQDSWKTIYKYVKENDGCVYVDDFLQQNFLEQKAIGCSSWYSIEPREELVAGRGYERDVII